MSAIFFKIKKGLSRGAKRSGGTSLVETILYMALLVVVMGVIVRVFVGMSGVYRELKLTREIESSGTVAMESMLREIRGASSVVIGESVLGSNPGALKVSGVDESLNPYNVTFNISSGAIRVSKDGGTPASLTSSPVEVSSLVFTRVATSTSEGVRIEIEVSGTSGSISKSKRFYGFSVLRGSY